ncbi:hypothetical protein BJV77DRAFT_414017 [Russula vinacea]|nr:hypothetical protein BJV77DRAFT_414017 [Russula vinacea]
MRILWWCDSTTVHVPGSDTFSRCLRVFSSFASTKDATSRVPMPSTGIRFVRASTPGQSRYAQRSGLDQFVRGIKARWCGAKNDIEQ